MFKRIVCAVLLLGLFLAACSGNGESTGDGAEVGEGNPERGETLFEQMTIGSNAAPGCVTCHSLEPGRTLVGPSLANIGAEAGGKVEGMPAEDYLRQSIVEPDAHIAEGFPVGIMYQNYEQDLTGQEINDLVAYMLTLE